VFPTFVPNYAIAECVPRVLTSRKFRRRFSSRSRQRRPCSPLDLSLDPPPTIIGPPPGFRQLNRVYLRASVSIPDRAGKPVDAARSPQWHSHVGSRDDAAVVNASLEHREHLGRLVKVGRHRKMRTIVRIVAGTDLLDDHVVLVRTMPADKTSKTNLRKRTGPEAQKIPEWDRKSRASQRSGL